MVCDVQSYYRDQLRNDGIDRALGYQEKESFSARMTADSSPKTNTGGVVPSLTTTWCRLLCGGDTVTQCRHSGEGISRPSH